MLVANVARPATVVIIEGEGPRPFFRAKLRRKLLQWRGSPIEDRIRVHEEPWAQARLDTEVFRQQLADKVCAHSIDVVIIGPVTRVGMDEAGTLQQTRDCSYHLGDVRRRAGRAVAIVLIHHENRAGSVSGAWEAWWTRCCTIRRRRRTHPGARAEGALGTDQHKRTLSHTWVDGEGFEVGDEPERDDNAIADEILTAVHTNPGESWSTIEKAVKGNRNRNPTIRDRLLERGQIVDYGKGNAMKLWHVDDPARPTQDQPIPVGNQSWNRLIPPRGSRQCPVRVSS